MTVLVIDSHTLLTAGLTSLLGRQRDIRVVAVSARNPSMYEQVRQENPRLVIVESPHTRLVDLERLLRESDTSVLVLNAETSRGRLYSSGGVEARGLKDVLDAIGRPAGDQSWRFGTGAEVVGGERAPPQPE